MCHRHENTALACVHAHVSVSFHVRETSCRVCMSELIDKIECIYENRKRKKWRKGKKSQITASVNRMHMFDSSSATKSKDL